MSRSARNYGRGSLSFSGLRQLNLGVPATFAAMES